MKYVRDLCSPVKDAMVPVCMECICASCNDQCESCPGDTDTGHCVKWTCEKEAEPDIFD